MDVKKIESLAKLMQETGLTGLELVDQYSSMELGLIATQCPQHRHYHVQAENVFVEILDDSGRPCRPGETGQVVVTASTSGSPSRIHAGLTRSRRTRSGCLQVSKKTASGSCLSPPAV